MNLSKKRDPRFMRRWIKSGAVPVPTIILNTEEFLKWLKPGDQFWILSNPYEPTRSIEGPVVINKIFQYDPKIFDHKTPEKALEGTMWISVSGKPFPRSIRDLTGRYYGVFLRKKDAKNKLTRWNAL